MTWHMARAASKRTPRWDGKLSTKVVGERPAPCGELYAAWDENDQPFAIACKLCGHDVCDCDKAALAEQEAARIRDHIAEQRRLFEARQAEAAQPSAFIPKDDI